MRSTDPKVCPVIDPRYLTEPADLAILREAHKFIRKVAYTEPFKNLILEEVPPGNEFDLSSDKEIEGMTLLFALSVLQVVLISICETASSNTFGHHSVRQCNLSEAPY